MINLPIRDLYNTWNPPEDALSWLRHTTFSDWGSGDHDIDYDRLRNIVSLYALVDPEEPGTLTTNWQRRAGKEAFDACLQRMPGLLKLKDVISNRSPEDTTHTISALYWHDGKPVALEFYVDNFSENLAIKALTGSKTFIPWMTDLLAELTGKPDFRRQGSVHVMVSMARGLTIKQIENPAGSALQADNYHPEVVAGYGRLTEDLLADKPRGRIHIINGPPGTGKTYLLRALLQEIGHKTTAIILPPNIVPQMQGPDILPMLMGLREDSLGVDGEMGALVFLVEDADAVLAERMADNLSGISAMLNFGDGILGASLDVRFVCTTNAPRQELDSAIVRPGRLGQYLDVQALSPEQALQIVRRETQKDLTDTEILSCFEGKNALTLAEIYSVVSGILDDEQTRAARRQNKNVMGF